METISNLNPSSNISKEEINGINLLNPLASLTSIINLINNLPSIKDSYNHIAENIASFTSEIIELFTSDIPFFDSALNLGEIILTPIITLTLSVNSLFGFSTPNTSNSFIDINENNDVSINEIISIDFIIMLLGIQSELLSGVKESTFVKTDSMKLIITLIKTVISGASLSINGVRKSMISIINNQDFHTNDFYSKKAVVMLKHV